MFLKSKILILNSNKGGHMIKQYKKIYKSILNEIVKYDTIAVYRHTSPDFDASGTQNGLVTWLKDSFPNKKIYPLKNNRQTHSQKLLVNSLANQINHK